MRAIDPRTVTVTVHRWPLVVVSIILFSASISGCVVLGNAHSRQQIDVEEFAGAHWQDWEPMSGLKVVSKDLCAGANDCIQAVASEHLVIMKFESVSSATAYVNGGSASLHQIDPLVIDFQDTDLSRAVQEAVISTLSNINADSPD